MSSDVDLNQMVADVSVEAASFEVDAMEIEAVSNSIVGLEALAEQIEASLEGGGLDRFGAGLVTVAVESHLGQFGIKVEDAIPSLESFGGESTREQATTISVESIKEKANDLIKWLVGKFEEVRQKIMEWYKKSFSTAASLKASAEKLAKAAGESNGTLKDDVEKIKLGGGAKYLYLETTGKVDAGKLISGTDALKSLTRDFFQDHGAMITKMADLAEKTFKAAADAPKETWEGKDESAVYKDGKFLGAVTYKELFDALPKGDTNVFLGGKILRMPKMAGKLDTLEDFNVAVKDLRVRFESKKTSAGKAVEVADDQEIDALKLPDISKVADGVAEVAASIQAYETDYFKYQKSMEKAMAAARKVGEKTDKYTLGSVGRGTNKVVASKLKLLQDANSYPATQITSCAIGTSKALLDVCQKSLAQYA